MHNGVKSRWVESGSVRIISAFVHKRCRICQMSPCCYLSGLLPNRLSYLLLLLLSHFSRVQLCATPETAAHQPPPSLGFSRQEHWSGLPFPSPMLKVKSESEVAQSCLTLSDPMDCNPPGSSTHGIFQARVLEWGAIAFSELTRNYC